MKYQYHLDGTKPPYDLDTVFVFGSNLSGIHGAGAAKEARMNYGAVMGIGTGMMGNSYAIPTKDRYIDTLLLKEIEQYVNIFKRSAATFPHKKFFVTAIGCGLAGYTAKNIAPLFRDSPTNCNFPDGWQMYLE